jgi:hypothetical protein
MVDSVDYIYWAFSAAAQSISAFVALLLTGYALVQTLMESSREKDDSLEEIHNALRLKYHRHLRALAIVTGSAIVLSLAVAYFNRPTAPVGDAGLILVALLDLVAIAGGLAFVVSIVDPRKYEKAAVQVLEKETPVPREVGQRVPATEFFDAFRHLERVVRDYLRQHELYVPSRGAPRMSFSFRQMIEALLQNEKIDRKLFDELVQINKYRNLVFHGHVDDADRTMVDKIKTAANQIGHLE